MTNLFNNPRRALVALMAFATLTSSAASIASSSTNCDTKVGEEKNIVEIAQGAGNFSTLVAALSAAGLVEALSGEGKLTVFAPTDAAFARLPEGTVEALLNDIPTLTKILTFHVVAGEKGPRTLLNEMSVTTLNGDRVSISTRAGNLFINDSKVTARPIKASNGVIYVIDAVLLP